MKFLRLRNVSALLLALAVARPSHAVTVKWNTINGSFSTASNWTDVANASNHVVPLVNDTATFKHTDSTNHSIAIPGRPIATPATRQVKQLKFGFGVYEFYDDVNLSTQLPAIFSVDAADTLGEGAIIVGDVNGDRAEFDDELATLNAASLTVGNAAGSDGTFYLISSPSATLNVTGAQATYPLTVGYSGTGYLSANGNINVAGNVAIGRNAGATGYLSLSSGGSMTAKKLMVGMAGYGNLDVDVHSNLTCDELTISGLLGIAHVRGTGFGISGSSTITSKGAIDVGKGGVGLFEVDEDGLATSASASLGANNGNGTASVDGAGSKWTNNGVFDIGTSGSGRLIMANGGSVISTGLITLGGIGSIGGNGTVTGNVSNSGRVMPGDTFNAKYGTLHLTGDFTQSYFGGLEIELGGTTAGTDYDQFLVTGNVAAGGLLEVFLRDSFAPQEGDTFNILDFASLSGSFDFLDLPFLSGALQWNSSKLYTDGIISVMLPGDYDQNGVVGASDYVLWRKSKVTGLPLANDDTPGIGTDDFTRWRTYFGQTPAGGAGSSSSIAGVAIPEPMTALLLLIGAIAGFALRRAA